MEAFRMIGRLDGAVAYLLDKYHLAFNQSVADWTTLFTALSTRVNDYDRAFCLKLATASEEYVKETQGTTLSQFRIDDERRLGMEDADFVFRQWPDTYADYLLQDRDFAEEKYEERRKKQTEITRNIILGVCCVAMIVVAVIVYNLPYFAEQREYGKVQEQFESGSKTMLDTAVGEYVKKYPQGAHLSEVLVMPVRFSENSKDVIETLEAVENYLRLDPSGAFRVECRQISDSIWDMEIHRYETMHTREATTEGKQFVVSMLNYMKENQVRTVLVKGNAQINLKEYSEYPYNVRSFLEQMTAYPEFQKEEKGRKVKLPDDMVTIKDKITQEDASAWISYIIMALQKGFNDVLTPNFLLFHLDGTPSDTIAGITIEPTKNPLVIVNYTVENQEIAENVPDIWIHSSTYGGVEYTSNLFLGIGMTFDANFTLPGEKTSFHVAENGDAGDKEIHNTDSKTVYSVMCERSTKNFARKISEEFGLK